MNKSLLLLLCIIVLCSCTNKSIYPIDNPFLGNCDSTFLYRSDSVVRINIGGYLNPNPSASQFYKDSFGSYYIMLDENCLYLLDLNSGKQVKKDLSCCGRLNNYSGFLYLGDTLFVYAYKDKIAFMLNKNDDIMKKWLVKDKSLSEHPVDVEAITDFPMLYIPPKLFMSGSSLGSLEGKDLQKYPVECSIDINESIISYSVEYPEQYRLADFGGVYMNNVYHSVANDGNIVYSFPTDHSVHFYSDDMSYKKSVYMGSRYSDVINSSNQNSMELFKDKEQRIRYYISQHSYARVLYDKYRGLYYRIAQHPLLDWDGGNFVKPFSIIVMNEEGELLCETPIVEDYSSLNLHNMHVTEEGLLIQRKTKDENVIEFVKYVIE
ncbi:MAG: DUF4221 family protein [Bacteroides sp.]|nr:DUF4221 family protein [Bacteroides sp.]